MRISFFSSRIEFSGNALEKQGLGGSESALINLSRAWKKLYPADEITVYARCDENIYNNISWKRIEEFYLACYNFDQDIVISLREPMIFSNPYIDSKVNILWSQDLSNESSLQNLKYSPYTKSKIDLILSVSEFAKQNLEKVFLDNKIVLMRNGYNATLIQQSKKENVAVYASTPFRGLENLVKLWPKILNKCYEYSIDPTLKIFGDMSLYNQDNREYDTLYNNLEKLNNVQVIKSVPQKKLYEELNKAKVMLYPCNYIETSCMAVLEALGCKVAVVTSDLGAMAEQVIDKKNGFLCDYNSNTFEEDFIEKSVKAFVEHDKFEFPKVVFSWYEQAVKMRKVLKKCVQEY